MDLRLQIFDHLKPYVVQSLTGLNGASILKAKMEISV